MKVKSIGNYFRAGWLSLAILLALSPGAGTASDLDSPPSQGGSNLPDNHAAPSDPVENSVVKILCTARYPDYYKPWTKQAPAEVSGSGVVIKGKRILTNAHVVLYAGQIQIQASGSGNLISATVEFIAPGIDLAVLKLDDDSFFDSHPPLAMASGPPEIQDAVSVYGYPMGGDNLSITKGIVSRVEFAAYNFPVDGLRVQIDAAINPGNSGGPAVVNGKMIGIAFSKLGGQAENIGNIIPCEEVNLFLQSVDAGSYHKPRLFDECQPLSNPTLRSYLKLGASVQGVIVDKPVSSDEDYPLKKWDVITRIGGTPVNDEGMVNLSGDLYVDFRYLIQKIATNGTVPLTVVRDDKEISIQLPLIDQPKLMPFLDDGYPSYFVYGPAVFTGATAEFVAGLSRGASGSMRLLLYGMTDSPLLARLGDTPAFKGEGLVVVCSPLFPDKLSRGYRDPFGKVVKSVNGIEIKNLKHFVQVLHDCKDAFVRIEFYGNDSPILVFPRAEMAGDTDSILTDNDIRSQGSPDVMAIWNAGSPE